MQAAHAAYEAGAFFESQDYPGGNYLIACSVPDEQALLRACDRLARKRIAFVLFREPDQNNEATALCTEPLNDQQRKVLSNYPLWGKEINCSCSSVR